MYDYLSFSVSPCFSTCTAPTPSSGGYADDSRAIETMYPNGKVVARTYIDRNQLEQVDYDASMVSEFE